MYDDDEELQFVVESNDDDTEIALVVTSPSGRKITQHEFIMCCEQYLHDVTQAEIYRREKGALNH